ncbi:hypothetical protein OG2516_06369 [Oceanicola granulosus HTCC2516]|uniref:MarR family transcriptional regulator n=1 Tax=Oceanicola granulosus (strain ATCC BAA-861 / DSM 15982 / KCTC 12143 / HTCC2516) TaxID=314256 RepID=Q2CBQ8_OCEGH|nr:hypothetical protein [Oceanicola granulosus]EAR50073.1 hypothetical protein OG2516_06369 [Oceanicola granulosus HTCC2516]
MRTQHLSSIAKLRSALWQMEIDSGLAELSQNEKDVLYAFHLLSDQANTTDLTSERVRQQSTVSRMTHATFHRALRKLLELGYVELAPDRRAKLYRLGTVD